MLNYVKLCFDLISLAGDVTNPPLTSVTTPHLSQIGASEVQAPHEILSQPVLDNSVASIGSVILEASDSNNLNSNRTTIQLT